MPKHEQLDLRHELLELADRILENGIQPGTLVRGTLHQVVEVLFVGIAIPDAGYRATAIAYGLRRLAEGIGAPEVIVADEAPYIPNPHRPIDTTNWSSSHTGALSAELSALEIPCPECGQIELVLRGPGQKMPYICRHCGHEGFVR